MPNYDITKEREISELLIDCFMLSEKNHELVKKTPRKTKLYEIYFIVSGNGTFTIDEKDIEIKSSSVLFVSPGRWRQWKQVNNNLDAYVVIFKDEFISSFFHDYLFLYHFHFFYNENKPFHLHVTDSEEEEDLNHIFDNIKIELESLKNDSKHFLRAYLYYLLVFLNRQYKAYHGLSTELIDDLLAAQFRQLLEAELHNLESAEKIAEEMEISVSKLNKVTKKTFGKNASQMIKKQRLLEAKRLLMYTTMDAAQISNELKYSNPSNFNRIFKDATGKTPTNYRKSYMTGF